MHGNQQATSKDLKGDKGEDGKTPEITTKPGADGKSTDVTITVPGKDPVTVNIKDGKDGKDGKSLVAKKKVTRLRFM